MKCECGSCKTCKRREYRRRERKSPANQNCKAAPRVQKLDALDLKAMEVWQRHKPADPIMRWRCPIAEFEHWGN